MSIKNELHSMHNAISKFTKDFEEQFGEQITVIIGETDAVGDNRTPIVVIEKITLNLLKIYNPEYENVESFSYRTRKHDYQMHLQAFCLITFMQGYSKSAIARHIGKNHASIINAIDSAENYIFCKSSTFLRIHTNILTQLKDYVGISEDNSKEQNNTKSSNVTILNERESLIAHTVS